MSDELIELPEGWEWTIAIEACSKVIDCHNKTAPYTDSGIKLVRTSNIRNGKIDLKTTKFVDQPTYEFWSRRCFPEPGDLLFTREAPMAEVGMIPPEEKICMGQRMMLLRADNQNLLNSYLLYVLQAPFIKAYADRVSVGTGVKHLRVKDVESLPIPIPPIAEQKRIVAKIEELRSKTQKAREALEAILEMCDRFRQSVLAAAFRGDLTADWREGNPDVESAKELLLRLQKQQMSLIVDETEVIDPLLPESWCRVQVEKIGEVFLGRQRSPKNHTGLNMRPYVRAANITWNGWDLSDVKEMNFDDRDFKKYKLKIGDVLINEGSGSADEVGKPAIWQNNIENCCFQNTLICVRPFEKMSEYLYFIFLYAARSKAFVKETRGVNIHHIGKERLASFYIALPPLLEQVEIVRQIQIFFKAIDHIQQQYEEAKARLEKLDRAILAKAFRGELVPQDPNDEPASVLLERIREERAKVSDQKTTKRKR